MSIGWDTVAIAALVLVAWALAAWLGRDRRYRRIRIGVFVERTRWEDDEDTAEAAAELAFGRRLRRRRRQQDLHSLPTCEEEE